MTWISYLIPLTLYHGKTVRSTSIEVREACGQRKMDLNGYPQSGSLYRRIWKKVLERRGKAKNVLLLGLGGGDVVKQLTSQHTHGKIVVVELEAEVVRVAKDYFGIIPNEKLQIVTEDAKTYVKRNKQRYELVIVDLYSGDGVPKFVETKRFLSDVKRAITLDGQAIFNYASHSFREDDFVCFEKLLNGVFTSVNRLKVWGHTFYVAK
ncbi:MAG: fused MFS/spermidine synthase [bacterium]